jgi:hypothetical protein
MLKQKDQTAHRCYYSTSGKAKQSENEGKLRTDFHSINVNNFLTVMDIYTIMSAASKTHYVH